MGKRIMLGLGALILVLVLATPAAAQQEHKYILRVPATDLDYVTRTYGLTIVRTIRDDVYLVKGPGWAPETLQQWMKTDPLVKNFELDSAGKAPEASLEADLNQSTAAILESLRDKRLANYFGATTWVGYSGQPASVLIRAPEVHQKRLTGDGIVAIIDTGVDPSHPALKSVLTSGYDFTRDLPGPGSEWPDLNQSTAAILEQSTAAILEGSSVVRLNQSTAAILEQSTAAILESNKPPAAFGHGTMVAGLVHLVAPTAKIMPLKAFNADGSARTSDIVRAIYYAVDKGAKVINMSFSMEQFSDEVMRAINYATRKGVICVASVGNQNKQLLVYPATLGNVLGVASTTSEDKRSAYSNYGADLVKVAAPGDSLITTYPGGRYAAVWGTSFSSGLVSGAAALLLNVDIKTEQEDAKRALAHAKQISEDLGYGRIDLYEAVKYLKTIRGLLVD